MKSSGMVAAGALAVCLTGTGAARAQSMPPGMSMTDDQMPMDHDQPGWHLGQAGVVVAMFNAQGSSRGGNEFVVPNWWMGMATRKAGRQRVGLQAMFSLDAATVGLRGYRELFQSGEAVDGEPLVDRQHPHDFAMQLTAWWERRVGERARFAIGGGPAGEATLGPTAFMHRASAAELPMAPLGHHTFDSTHVSFGVMAGSFTYRGITMEASAFNGREPDQHRWDLDLGPLDSYAGRFWIRPRPTWELQVSSGHLHNPEELTPGDVVRTTASASWLSAAAERTAAMTVGYGVNAAHGDLRQGAFGEFSRERRGTTIAGRLEVQQVEADVLLGESGASLDAHAPASTVVAVTAGVTRRIAMWRGFGVALGGEVVINRPSPALRDAYGAHPAAGQVFLRVRLPQGSMGPMWNMRMLPGGTD